MSNSNLFRNTRESFSALTLHLFDFKILTFLTPLCLSFGYQWQCIACQSKLQEKLLSKFFNFVWEVCFPKHTWEDLNKRACLSSLSNANLGHEPKYGGTHTSRLDIRLILSVPLKLDRDWFPRIWFCQGS